MVRRQALSVARAALLPISLFVTGAQAAYIVDQQPTAGIGLASDIFDLETIVSVLEIDSFTTTVPYRLGTLTAFTSSDGLGGALSVTGSIYSGAPPGDAGANLVTTAFGTLEPNHDLSVDFGGGLLPAGTYYITAFVSRNTVNDGIWFWNTTFSGPQALTWPIGQGLPPSPETSMFTASPLALAYTLTGTLATAVPEPPTWALLAAGFAVAGLLSSRPRLRRVRS